MDARASRLDFSPVHVRDRSLFAAFLAACWLGVGFGFYGASSARFSGHADYPAPLILIGHAILFSAWLALLTAQIVLVRSKRLRLHKRLGRLGFVLVPLMVYSAVAAEVHSQRFYIQRHDDDLHFFILPLFYDDKEGWQRVMRNTIAFNASFFNTHRMVQQYALKAYLR